MLPVLQRLGDAYGF